MNNNEQVKPLIDLYKPPQLIHLLESGQWGGATKKIKNAFKELAEESRSNEHTLEVFHMISNSFIYIAHKNGKLLRDIIGDEIYKITRRYYFDSIKSLEAWSLSIVELFKNEDKDTLDNRSNIVRDVQHYIASHLNQDISLTAISQHVHLHPVYLSKIYKLETGDALSDYIHRLRMNKAAFLLTHTRKKIYEIAENIGFQNTSYFIRVFKKYFTVTPQEYRNEETPNTNYSKSKKQSAP